VSGSFRGDRVTARNTAAQSENAIHDDEVARQYGFRGGLVPGVTVYAYLTHPLVEAWGRAHRTDKRCSLGSLAARCGWATCGLPCGPRPDTRHGSRHRGEGDRRHRDRPLTPT